MSGGTSMPHKDGTGPLGKGPKTGRQEGNCKDAQPIERAKRQGRCSGRMGRGRCRE